MDHNRATGYLIDRFVDNDAVVIPDDRPQGLSFDQIRSADLDRIPLVPRRASGDHHSFPQFHMHLMNKGDDPEEEYIVDINEGEKLPSPPDPWDLRAKAEREEVNARHRQEWLDSSSGVGNASCGAGGGSAFSWRNDVRLRENASAMGEWTLKQTWNHITEYGSAADPRDVIITVEDPEEEADTIAEGFDYSWLDDIEYLDDRGLLLHDSPPRPLRILDGIGPDEGPTKHAAGEYVPYGDTPHSEWWLDLL